MFPLWATWSLLVVGITYALTESSILGLYRILVSRLGVMPTVLVYCPSCTGFWVGLGLGFVVSPFELAAPWHVFASAIGAMAIMTTWSGLRGGNPAFMHEQELRGGTHESTTEETHE